MTQEHIAILENDYRELKSFLVRLKLLYYFFQRYVWNSILRRILKKRVGNNASMETFVDQYVRNEGGLFKSYTYKICNKEFSIKNASVLVAGVGFGRNIFQLAQYKPKLIVGFDLFDYSQEWEYLQDRLRKEFGVESVFVCGDAKDVGERFGENFDIVLSDAVLEHVQNPPVFLNSISKLLKRGGLFYASFGPIWYGPGGDHFDWGRDNLFFHLLSTSLEYEKRVLQKESLYEENSLGSVYMWRNKLFSYYTIKQYLDDFQTVGFIKIFSIMKISMDALSFLERREDISSALNHVSPDIIDRFCLGLCVWYKKE